MDDVQFKPFPSEGVEFGASLLRPLAHMVAPIDHASQLADLSCSPLVKLSEQWIFNNSINKAAPEMEKEGEGVGTTEITAPETEKEGAGVGMTDIITACSFPTSTFG